MTKKLVVGLVFDDSLDRPDGVQQYVQRVAEWLLSEGHEVHFLVGETTRSDLANVHSLARNLRVKFNGNTMSMPLPTKKRDLQTVLDTYDFDILHVQVPFSPLMAGRLMRLAKAKTAVVGTFHILPYSPLVVLANRLLAAANAPACKRITAMMAVSPPAKTFADELYHFDCQVIPNPIRVSDFPPEPSVIGRTSHTPRVVFLGRLVERKGARQLLQAVAYLHEHKLYDGVFEVVIGGRGEQLDSLRQYVQDHGLMDIVSFPGFIPEDEKAALLASADLAVFPSISGESFGISLLEAMAAARGVVLAGNNPGYASVMHGLDERLFDPLQTADLAATLAQWLRSESKRLKAAEQQRTYVEQFDIDHVGRQIEKVYTAALAKLVRADS